MLKESPQILSPKIEKLLNQASRNQMKKFLKQLLRNNAQTAQDFEIFIQGPKQTTNSSKSYKDEIVRLLDKLDLEDLEQAWLTSDDDFYDYYPSYRENDYDDQTLACILDPFRQQAQKYASVKNFSECHKIFRAITEALIEKIAEIGSDHLDLKDWFLKEINETMKLYSEILHSINNAEIKLIDLEYICVLFEQETFEQDQDELGTFLKEASTGKSDAEVCLSKLLHTIKKTVLSQAESSLLAYLYQLAKMEKEFERICLNNIKSNHKLILPLLNFYKDQKCKKDIITIANQALDQIHKDNSHFYWDPSRNLEIEIRELLKTVFDPKTEYRHYVDNLESLFMKSKNIKDYQELTQFYRKSEEKVKFLDKIRIEFIEQKEIEAIFKVFRLEDMKQEILELTDKYMDHECFADMIATISSDFPQKCFLNYRSKITDLLKVSNVEYYPKVVLHLKQMRLIGLTEDFNKFINWISAFYKRRYRLTEEMHKGGLT